MLYFLSSLAIDGGKPQYPFFQTNRPKSLHSIFEMFGIECSLYTSFKWGCTGFDVGAEAKGAYRGACGPL